MKGYKVFNSDWTCKGFQYEVGQTCEMAEKPQCCRRGFHFCERLVDCFSYYRFDLNNRVAEVEALGDIDTDADGDKVCTNKIKIVRELTWEEVLSMCNAGKGNTGIRNTGNCNSGNCNSGNCNTGDCNTGYRNSGDDNSGDRNSGDCNTGDRNTGYGNSGDDNSGDRNSGNRNTGDWNSGDCNTGDWNSGHGNSGNRNSGNNNTGDWNSGDRNTGDWNSGDRNTGDWNSGYRNSGDRNTGDWNSGNRNTGDWNTGDWNISSYNTGCFNTEGHTIMFFNKPSSWSYSDWLDSKARRVIDTCPVNDLKWMSASEMSEEEKAAHPDYEVTGGYLKEVACTQADKLAWWKNLLNEEREVVQELPNFDEEIFLQCIGAK